MQKANEHLRTDATLGKDTQQPSVAPSSNSKAEITSTDQSPSRSSETTPCLTCGTITGADGVHPWITKFPEATAHIATRVESQAKIYITLDFHAGLEVTMDLLDWEYFETADNEPPEGHDDPQPHPSLQAPIQECRRLGMHVDIGMRLYIDAVKGTVVDRLKQFVKEEEERTGRRWVYVETIDDWGGTGGNMLRTGRWVREGYERLPEDVTEEMFQLAAQEMPRKSLWNFKTPRFDP